MCKVVMCGYVIVPVAQLELLAIAIKEHIKLTLAEPGCVEFTLTADENDPCRFSLYEEFSDKAAFDYHQKRTRESKWYKASRNIERHFNIIEQ